MEEKKKLIVTLFILSLLFPLYGFGFQSGGDEENPFVVRYDEGPIFVKPDDKYVLKVEIEIPDSYYLYEEKTDLLPDFTTDFKLNPVKKPGAIMKHDPFFGRILPVYFNKVTLEFPLEIPQSGWTEDKTVTGDIQFQGCSNRLCYKPMHVPLKVTFRTPVQIQGESPKETKTETKLSFNEIFHASDFSLIASHGFAFSFLIAFLGGLLTNFTPCVWPMIPITLAVIGVRKDQSISKNFFAVLTLVFGMAVMYALLGVVAAILGKSLGFLFQHTFFLILLEMVLILMAFSLLGFFEIRLPSRWQSRLASFSAVGFRGIFFVGLTMGLIATPCVGPIVGPLLVYVAQSKSILFGFFLLLAYALGIGVLFLVLGTFYGLVRLRLKGGIWTLWLKKGLGVVMLLTALYYGRVLYAQIVAHHPGDWEYSLKAGLDRAHAEQKPVLLDFFALWCPPCVELDKNVFSHPEIENKLQRDWIRIKVDCTKETPECKEAIEQFHVIGWPTVLFLNRHLEEQTRERLVGRVVSPDEMKTILERVE